jgi:hypothetical protein
MEKKGSSEAGLAKIQPFVSEASGKRAKITRVFYIY